MAIFFCQTKDKMLHWILNFFFNCSSLQVKDFVPCCEIQFCNAHNLHISSFSCSKVSVALYTCSNSIKMMLLLILYIVLDPCSLPPERIDCFGNEERWYFNRHTGTCETFRYAGCGGNENRFRRKSHCTKMCITSRGISIARLMSLFF